MVKNYLLTQNIPIIEFTATEDTAITVFLTGRFLLNIPIVRIVKMLVAPIALIIISLESTILKIRYLIFKLKHSLIFILLDE
jgi:hypothetical protein